MGRGAPNKPGLTYFPKMLDFYEDDKIFDLLDEYGPLGVTIYDCILCIVYKNGYYAEIPLDKLSKMIIKMIGNKWVKNQKVVVQVVHFCSDIGLLDDALMTENIITSVGIQRRYYEIAVKRMKRQLYSDKYWILDKEKKEEPLLNAPIIQDSSEINGINSEEIQITSEKSPIEIKENKSIYIFPNPEVERAFKSGFGQNFIAEKNYLVMPMKTYKEVIHEIPQGIGVLVPIPVYADKYEEFENPTELSKDKEWKLYSIIKCIPKLRKRSMTELLFCMLRSGH